MASRLGLGMFIQRSAGLLRQAAPPPRPLSPDQPAVAAASPKDDDGRGEGDDDALESFMAEINGMVDNQQQERKRPQGEESAADALETTEAGEGFVRSLDAAAAAAGYGDEDADVYAAAASAQSLNEDDLAYDSDGNVIGVRAGAAGSSSAAGGKKSEMEPLPRVDHSKIAYEPFERSFYAPPPDAVAAAEAGSESIAALRAELELTVEGERPPPPVVSFMHLGFHSHPPLLTAIANAGYEAPTAIQSQALPVLLSGRDLIGLAVTGSGKTLGYILPLVRHCIAQRELEAGEGPIGVILSPTRELATQIYAEVRRFAKALGMGAALLTGGSSKWEQTKLLKSGVEIVVATPGRLIEHVGDGNTNLRRTTLLVLDEADRMFDMGFQKQVYSIIEAVRPDRQTAMFSATFPPRIEALARVALSHPIKVVVGTTGQANANVKQTVLVLPHEAKWGWLESTLPGLLQSAPSAKVLVFVSGRAAADELCASINRSPAVLAAACPSPSGGSAPPPPLALSLHGEKHQSERDDVMRRFKKAEARILVATDIASRGLDVRNVVAVVNFDAARNIDTHVHRIGRTGRMGQDGSFIPGVAFTLLKPSESSQAVDLLHSLRGAEQEVPPALLALAKQSPRFRRGGGGGSRAPAGTGGVKADGSWVGPGPGARGARAAGSSGTLRLPPGVSGSGGWGRGGAWGASSAAPGLGFGAERGAEGEGVRVSSGSGASVAATGGRVPPPSSSAPTASRGGTGSAAFQRAVDSSQNFSQGSSTTAPPPRRWEEEEDEGEPTHLTAAAAAAAAAATGYHPPMPQSLTDSSARIDASLAAAREAVHAAGRADALAAADVARAIRAVRAGVSGLPEGDPAAGVALGTGAGEEEDGNDLGDVDIDGDDEHERSNLRRRRGSRFGGYMAGEGTAAPGEQQRSRALGELTTQRHARYAEGFASSFVASSSSSAAAPGSGSEGGRVGGYCSVGTAAGTGSLGPAQPYAAHPQAAFPHQSSLTGTASAAQGSVGMPLPSSAPIHPSVTDAVSGPGSAPPSMLGGDGAAPQAQPRKRSRWDTGAVAGGALPSNDAGAHQVPTTSSVAPGPGAPSGGGGAGMHGASTGSQTAGGGGGPGQWGAHAPPQGQMPPQYQRGTPAPQRSLYVAGMRY